MNRRNFLAFIPSLSAIPYIGNNIEKTDSGIFIAKPEPVRIVKSLDNIMDLEVRLYANGQHVGDAYINTINVHAPLHTTCKGYTLVPGNAPGEMNIECRVVDYRQLVNNIYGY